MSLVSELVFLPGEFGRKSLETMSSPANTPNSQLEVIGISLQNREAHTLYGAGAAFVLGPGDEKWHLLWLGPGSVISQ